VHRHVGKVTSPGRTVVAGRAPRTVVIGSGMGGSAVTLLLAYAGVPVTLLEKNKHVGGSCAGYEKQGFHIDFGTHLFTRGPYGPLGQVLDRVGRPDAVQFRRARDFAELRYAARPGSDEISSLRVELRPHRLPAFVGRVCRLLSLSAVEAVQAARLTARLLTISDDAAAAWNGRTAEEFLRRYCTNPRLISLLEFLLGLAFVLPSWQISAGEAIYCAQRMIRDNGLSYPLGGSRAVPITYCRLAQQMGAQLHTRAQVRRILTEDGRVRGVELRDGSRVEADVVVSTSSVRTTALRLCDPGTLPHAYTARAGQIVGSQSAVQVKIALKRKVVDAGLLIGGLGDHIDLVHAGEHAFATTVRQNAEGLVPDMKFFYCPVPTNFDPALAPPGHQLLTACMMAPTTDIERQVPDRAWEEALLRTMRRVVPDLEDHVLFMDRTTVPWLEHWMGKEFGPAISTAQTPEQVGALRPSVVTPVRGLYLAGCRAGGRGVGAELAADSGMECAERVLADLGWSLPAAWRRPRHEATPLALGIGRSLRPARCPTSR
jgi:phytoene dehydrogenase-like protein